MTNAETDALAEVLDTLTAERFDFAFKRPADEMRAAGTTTEDYDQGYTRAINYAVRVVEKAIAERVAGQGRKP